MPTTSFFSPLTSEVFIIAQVLVTICALFLLVLSFKAYQNTKLKKMIFIVIAFALFAIQHIINYVDQAVTDIMPDDIRYVLFAVITLAIMGMFFLAIVKK